MATECGGCGGCGGCGSDSDTDDDVSGDTVADDAPHYGSRVPVDTAPGPVPVCRAFKNPLFSSSGRR